MTLQEALKTTIALFLKKPDADGGEIESDLTALGNDTDLASRLVCFLPIALCRRVFGHTGVLFASHYVTIDGAGNETGQGDFLADPVYREALEYSKALLAPGEEAETYRSLAARSVDYKAIMKLHLQQGIPLNNLSLPPPRLQLPPGKAASPGAIQRESSRTQEVADKRPWYSRLWKRAE